MKMKNDIIDLSWGINIILIFQKNNVEENDHHFESEHIFQIYSFKLKNVYLN